MSSTPKACGLALPSRQSFQASPATRNFSRGTSSVSKSIPNFARCWASIWESTSTQRCRAWSKYSVTQWSMNMSFTK